MACALSLTNTQSLTNTSYIIKFHAIPHGRLSNCQQCSFHQLIGVCESTVKWTKSLMTVFCNKLSDWITPVKIYLKSLDANGICLLALSSLLQMFVHVGASEHDHQGRKCVAINAIRTKRHLAIQPHCTHAPITVPQKLLANLISFC